MIEQVKARAIVCLPFASQRELNTIFEALKPELDKPTTRRSSALLEKDDSSLVLKIEASDTIALRAALNAYLRWIKSVVEVLNVVKQNR